MRARNLLFTCVIWFAFSIVIGTFAWLIWDVVGQGFAKLSWTFLTELPQRSGRTGGIFPIIISTLLILSVAVIFVVPLGLGCAIWLAEFAPFTGRLTRILSFILDILAAVPSIVFGLFGYAFFCLFLGLGFSILAGGLTLACMMLPILIRTTESALNAVTNDWREAGAALGMSRISLLRHVLLPYAAPAISAGLLLAIGRATAETAALIFTSGYVDRMPSSLSDSGRALAVHIYDLSMNVLGGDKAAYASALVLIGLILLINIGANQLTHYWMTRRLTR
jgi:phosphate transport system permease protein